MELLILFLIPVAWEHPIFFLIGLIGFIILCQKQPSAGSGGYTCSSAGSGQVDESPQSDGHRLYANGDQRYQTLAGNYIYSNGMRSHESLLGDREYRENGEVVQSTLVDGFREVYDQKGNHIADEYDGAFGITYRHDRR